MAHLKLLFAATVIFAIFTLSSGEIKENDDIIIKDIGSDILEFIILYVNALIQNLLTNVTNEFNNKTYYQPSIDINIPNNDFMRGVIALRQTIFETDLEIVVKLLSETYNLSDPFFLHLELNVKRLILETEFQNKFKMGTIVNEYISNDGKLSIDLEDCILRGNITLDSGLEPNFEINLKKNKFDMTGFLNDELMSKDLSRIVTDNLPNIVNQILNEHITEIVSIVEEIAKCNLLKICSTPKLEEVIKDKVNEIIEIVLRTIPLS